MEHCSHMWICIRRGPIKTYECKYCNNKLISRLYIPVPCCKHEFIEDSNDGSKLGDRYLVYKCAKCNAGHVELK
jgi:hypothetical protein